MTHLKYLLALDITKWQRKGLQNIYVPSAKIGKKKPVSNYPQSYIGVGATTKTLILFSCFQQHCIFLLQASTLW
jgi:hypothetical protein